MMTRAPVSGVVGALQAMKARPDSLPLLPSIDVPTLVAAGDRDPFVPVDHAWGLARQIPHAQLLIAPDCPHEIMARRPALFNDACAGFYRSTEAIARGRSVRAWREADASP